MRKLCFAFALTVIPFVSAQAAPKVETVVDNLNNPCGVAIQPDTGHVFVADSGAGRIVRIVGGKAQDVIVGFSKDVYGKGPMYDIGPLGLVFLNRDTLVVGGGDLPDGEELLRAFKVPAAGQPAIQADAAIAKFNLPAEGELKAEGNFYGLASNGAAVFVSSNGDDTKGWVAKAEIKDGNIVSLVRSIATKEATEVDAPVGITFSPKGDLVVGQMGEINVPKDGLLTYYNASTGKMIMNLPTGLYDITALAYSPGNAPQLYATDFAWMKADEGGLFKLVSTTTPEGKQAVKAEKVVSLDKPTAMAFGRDGALYVTVVGTAAEGDQKKPGKLLKVTGL